MSTEKSAKTEFDEFRTALETSLGGFDQSVIGITGVFGREKTHSLARVLTEVVASANSLTSVLVPITRADIIDTAGVAEPAVWDNIQLRNNQFNAWPNKPEEPTVRYQIDTLQCLSWLRRKSDFAVLTFDTLEQVMDRLPLARRLDGLVIVNAGGDFEISVMAAAAEQLRENGVRLLGQVRRTGSAL